MRDLRAHDVEMLTIGQYLAPPATTCRSAATSIPTPSRCTRKKRMKMGFSRRRVRTDGSFSSTTGPGSAGA